jgi:LPXTG-motif cell wall-anchored protein
MLDTIADIFIIVGIILLIAGVIVYYKGKKKDGEKYWLHINGC